MRTRLIRFLFVAFVVSTTPFTLPSHAADVPKLAPVLQPFIDQQRLAGAVVLVADAEKVLTVEAIGDADIAAKKKLSTDAVFWIASMTKPIICTALMMMADEGKIDVDAPVSRYLPEFAGQWLITERDDAHILLKKPARQMLVRDLMSHTSGITRDLSFPGVPGGDDLPLNVRVAALALRLLASEPGAKYKYSNGGMAVVGRLVEKVSGVSYAEFLPFIPVRGGSRISGLIRGAASCTVSQHRCTPIMNSNSSTLSRRHFLRAAGITLALPVLNHFLPRGYAAAGAPPIRRMVAMNATLGLWPDHLFPQTAGHDYESTPYLEVLKEFRREMTIFSGVSHPGVRAGHEAEPCFLSAAPIDRGGTFRNSISLDQLVAEKLGSATRFSSLILTTGSSGNGGSSVNRGGVLLPSSNSPSAVFQKLFLAGSPGEINAQVARIEEGRSIMDVVLAQSKRLDARLGAEDRARLDQYFTSVRELEQRMVENQAWARKPKPKVDAKAPVDIPDKADFIARARQLFDLTRLALQTDSTRVAAIRHAAGAIPPIPGVTMEWHGLTHSGQDPEKIAELKLIEVAMLDVVREFLAKLKATPDQNGSLFDHTSVLYGSHLGHAGRHDCTNLPMMLFGGGFKHAGHLAFDREHNLPAARIFVAVLQRLGIETDESASGKGRIPGLELA